MKIEEIKNIIEAILFALGRIVSIEEIMAALDVSKSDTEAAVLALEEKYKENAGISLVKVGGGIQLVTNKKYYNYVAKFVENNKKENLSPSALEVLSIIAYNSKITKSEIESIRGTNSDSQVSKLIEYGLVEEVGRLKVPGRPAIFSVTNEFLRNMGINSVEELPDFEKMKNKEQVAGQSIEAEIENQLEIIEE